MSLCNWCDSCQRPFPDSDIDSQAMQVPVPKIENGVKVGISHTVERHRCGDCVRAEQQVIASRRAIESTTEAS